MTACYLVLLGMAGLLLFLELCTTGRELLSWHLYRGTASAVVSEVRTLHAPRSKGLVEESADGTHFTRIRTTEDREVGHWPFVFDLFDWNKNQYIFQWNAEGKVYRGHYPHLKSAGGREPGSAVPLRYKEGQPWKYAVADPAVRYGFLVRTALYVSVIAFTVLTFPAA